MVPPPPTSTLFPYTTLFRSTVTFRVVRIGTGAAALSSAASAVFIEERQVTGAPVGTAVALPTAASGSNHMLTMSGSARSEEHTSELQSRRDLVCRLLLEKKK